MGAGGAAHASDPLQEAQNHARQGQWAPALERVDQYLASRPRDAQARLLKGVILAELNRQNDALSVFSKLAEEFPDLPEPHNNMAVIYAQQKQFDRARNALLAALRTNPSYATAHENLGDVYARLASQAYDKALQMDSSSLAAQSKLTLIRTIPTAPRTEVAARAPAPAPVPAKPAQAPVAKPATSAVVTTTPPGPALVPGKPGDKPAEKADAKAEQKVEPKADAKGGQDAAATARLEVGRAIQAWAAAWSRKDVKTYLGSYSKDFQPPGRQSRGAWEAERSQRVSKPGRIDVDIDNLRVSVEGDKATAYFRQSYRSANLNSTGGKILVMVKRDGRWQIQQERVGN